MEPINPLSHIRCYVINLDRRPDRWKEATATLKKYGFQNIERISAVDGKLIDSDHVKTLLHPTAYDSLGKVRSKHEDLGSLGSVGCYLSHYKTWNEILKNNTPAIIVEDDILLNSTIQKQKIFQNSRVLDNYDFVLLGHWLRDGIPTVKSNGIYPFHGMFFGLHFYYLTPKGADFFMKGALPISYQVDSYMSFKMKKNVDFRSGAHFPSLANQTNNGTDIQTPMTFMGTIISIVSYVKTSTNVSKNVAILLALLILFSLLFYCASKLYKLCVQ
jgi:GR25 family glycosyltransferase involved in LPS biosynthesis